jgi:two-component system chemotaxis response regulator CheB
VSKIRVLVVDDSVVVRRFVSEVLAQDPAIEVVGTAVNGRAALTKVELLSPDIVTMDVEMPEMDGVEAVRQLRRAGSRIPIIMFSTLTERGASATLDALAAGATDYVTKPANVGSVSASMEQVRSSLVPRIKGLVPHARPAAAVTAAPAVPAPVPAPRRVVPRTGFELLVIGSSTGGPEAVSTLLAALPRLTVPVALVQHMPPLFTRQFAARLDRQLPYDVVEAEHGRVMAPGTVHVAPGDHHLRLVKRGGAVHTELNQGAPENYCRPAVDVLFRSAVDVVGGAVLGVVLTGMGSDGCRGAQVVVDAGGSVLAQDRETSVVWGMPGAVAGAGLAEEILPLDALAPAILRRLSPGRSPAGPAAVLGATRPTAPLTRGAPL